MLPIGQPSNGKMPGEKLPLKVGYFWTSLTPHSTLTAIQCQSPCGPAAPDSQAAPDAPDAPDAPGAPDTPGACFRRRSMNEQLNDKTQYIGDNLPVLTVTEAAGRRKQNRFDIRRQ